ncbi:MAG: restriction endonuclease [Cyanobacteria bacterium SIG28]|nr:restriction endonuclease [Cyanobacteria bacterium SIG28]
MSFLEELHKPDILDCISHLSSDEVFTPPKLVNEILDTLPQELFNNPETKFLDPCCKSGIFLREIAKRLIEGLEKVIPDLDKRIEHIFKNQLFGLAITELTGLLSRRSVYCSKNANGEYSICQFANNQGNIEYKRTYHIWFKDKCMMCNASKSEYDRDEELETHAYSFIHSDEQRNSELFKRLKDMKFDVIIGNPPYQLSDGGNAASAKPLYHLFVQQAKKLNPRYITMIIPARWYAGGKGLDSFRDEMLNDDRIRVIHDFPDASDCFPGVEIKGGVCYFLWNRDDKGLCSFSTHKKNTVISTTERPLLEDGCETLIRYNEAISILKKVQALNETTMDTQITSRKPFGFATDFKDYEKNAFENSIKIYARGEIGYIDKRKITQNKNLLDKIKVYVPAVFGNGSSGNTPDRIKPIIVKDPSCCTETYLIAGSYDDETLAENLASYMQTDFFHFLVALRKNTQHATKIVYSFVPIQDFNEEWTDEKLYKKYGLTQDETDFIKSMIKPMG